MSPTVPSVTGPISDLGHGIILPHEHLLIDYGIPLRVAREPVPDDLVDHIADRLSDLVTSGVTTLVDCTPPGYGRYLDLMATLSQRSGLQIVAATGSFCEAWAPLPWWVELADVEQLESLFRRELEEGAGDSRIRAGVIKAATGEVLSDAERRVLTAAARTQRRTGRSIVSHTTGGLGLDQLDIYAAEGAELTRVLISHVGFEPDPEPYAVAIAERGAYVGFDRIGHHHFFDDQHWLGLIAHLIGAGFADRILLSHDAVIRFSGPPAIGEHTFSDHGYLAHTFVPKLRDVGYDEELITDLTRRNAARWLYGTDPEDR